MDLMDDAFSFVVLLIIGFLVFLFAGWLVMVTYNELDLNQLVNGPDMEYTQGLGAALILGLLAR